MRDFARLELWICCKKLSLAKRKTSIEIVSYVCCMQRMQHIFGRLHLSNKTIKMRDDLQKAESILAMHIRIERIDLNTYLHSRNVSGTNSSRCNCEWSHQTTKHVLMHCSNWSHLRSRMLQDTDFSNYWIIVVITKNLRAVAKMMMKTKLLKQFRVTRTLVL